MRGFSVLGEKMNFLATHEIPAFMMGVVVMIAGWVSSIISMMPSLRDSISILSMMIGCATCAVSFAVQCYRLKAAREDSRRKDPQLQIQDDLPGMDND